MSFPSLRLFCNRRSRLLRTYTTLWADLEMAPADPIFGNVEVFHLDKHPKKINLTVCMYYDDNGQSYVQNSVLKAEKGVQSRTLAKEYLPITGNPLFCKQCAKLALGDNSEIISEKRYATAQSISATGSLRIAFDFIKNFFPGKKIVYISIPTWNYNVILTEAGLETGYYRYYNKESFTFDYAAVLEDINKIHDKSIILLQACAHNPTGLDPTQQQWDELSSLIKKKNLLPFFDMSYQGLASGDPDNDAYAVRKFAEDGHQLIVVQSFSKNMGLYGERIGAVTFVCKNKEEKNKLLSQLMIIIRGMYSTPPINGSRIVNTILNDPGLTREWKGELKIMSERCKKKRTMLIDHLQKLGSTKNWDYLTHQVGFLSMLGLTPEQVQKLMVEHGIYLVKTGRIAISGLTKRNIEYVANAIHQVTKE